MTPEEIVSMIEDEFDCPDISHPKGKETYAPSWLCKAKHDGVWVDSVIYMGRNSEKMYCRATTDFGKFTRCTG